MSNLAWCDLNSVSDILNIYDKCPNPKCNCQKIKQFTPHQYMLEGASIKSKLQKNFRGTETTWSKILKPGLKLAKPLISAATASKTKNPQSAEVKNNKSKSLTGGKILSLTDMHRKGLRLKVMQNHFK